MQNDVRVAEVHIVATDVTRGELVDRAVRLKREIEVKERELAKIKQVLRQEAEKNKELLLPTTPETDEAESKTIEFDGQLGSAQITFSQPVQDIDQGKANEIIKMFGQDFDRFFNLKIDYKDREQLKKFLESQPEKNSLFLSLTIQKPSKPRVVIMKT